MEAEDQTGLKLLAELRQMAESVATHSPAELVPHIAAELSGLLSGHPAGVVLREQGVTFAAMEPASDSTGPDMESLLHAFRELSGIGRREEVSSGRELPAPAFQAPIRVGENVIGLLASMQDRPEHVPGTKDVLHLAAELLGPALATRAVWMPRAYRDPLTNLYNRRWLGDELHRALASARRHRQEVSVVMLDIDGFKAINDTAGHAAGDRLLRRLAGTLAERVRREDAVCRYGGDEFVLLLPRTNRPDAWCVAQRVARKLDDVTLSCGAASSGTGKEVCSAAELLERADRALLKAKAAR